jgi:hypothetical protein
MNNTAVFTIASKNYLAYARTLLQSVREFHADIDLYLLLVDEVGVDFDPGREPYTVVEVKDLALPDYKAMAFKYDVVEFNTAVKPFFMGDLIGKGYRKVMYLDPDIMLFNSLDPILDLLDTNSIVLTPHITRPIPQGDPFRPSERSHLISGTYNLGFIAASACDATREFVSWWSARCSESCYNEPETGIFVDQKWINHVPGLFPDVHILRHPGCNMAYWNLHERTLDGMAVNGEFPLVFYHFSGISVDDLNALSKHQSKWTLDLRPDLREIFECYRDHLIENGQLQARNFSYAFDAYDNGRKIGTFARRLYAECAGNYPEPFSTAPGSYYRMLEQNGMLEACNFTAPSGDKPDTRRQADRINLLFRFMRMVLGVDRYIGLLKYLNYISVLRRQGFLLATRHRKD